MSDEMSLVRANPPDTVTEFDELDKYRQLFDDITGNGVVLKYNHRHALGELAITVCEMKRLRDDLRDRGEQIEVQGDRHIVTKKNASRDALEKLRPQLMRLMKEFRMTPASQGKSFGNLPNQQTDDGFRDI